MASLVAKSVKSLPTMWETWVQSLGQEDPLEKEMEIHFSILAWRILWAEEPDGYSPQRVGHDWVTKTFTSLTYSTGFILGMQHSDLIYWEMIITTKFLFIPHHHQWFFSHFFKNWSIADLQYYLFQVYSIVILYFYRLNSLVIQHFYRFAVQSLFATP